MKSVTTCQMTCQMIHPSGAGQSPASASFSSFPSTSIPPLKSTLRFPHSLSIPSFTFHSSLPSHPPISHSILPFDSSLHFLPSISSFDSTPRFHPSIPLFDSSLRFLPSIPPLDSTFEF